MPPSVIFSAGTHDKLLMWILVRLIKTFRKLMSHLESLLALDNGQSSDLIFKGNFCCIKAEISL